MIGHPSLAYAFLWLFVILAIWLRLFKVLEGHRPDGRGWLVLFTLVMTWCGAVGLVFFLLG
jgi:hypothetical protein